MSDARLVRLGLFEGQKLKGAIPLFIKKSRVGSVLNSLPFFGSNGGCIFARGVRSVRLEHRKVLLDAFSRLAKENDCISSTIVTSPLDRDDSYYSSLLKPDYTMDRVAQILKLPPKAESLMENSFTKKCRNSVRHAIGEGVKVTWEASLDALREVDEGQSRIMRTFGAVPRPSSFFTAVSRHLNQGDGYRVYRATLGDKTIALLLALYHRPRIVEYAVPVVPSEFRRYAPMNLIVHQVALDGIREGFRMLSFGGTRSGQSELHHFKASFGAVDFPYHYFTKGSSDLKRLAELGESELSSRFKWFFVLPFSTKGKPN